MHTKSVTNSKAENQSHWSLYPATQRPRDLKVDIRYRTHQSIRGEDCKEKISLQHMLLSCLLGVYHLISTGTESMAVGGYAICKKKILKIINKRPVFS
jgi:hypothetical protein